MHRYYIYKEAIFHAERIHFYHFYFYAFKQEIIQLRLEIKMMQIRQKTIHDLVYLLYLVQENQA